MATKKHTKKCHTLNIVQTLIYKQHQHHDFHQKLPFIYPLKNVALDVGYGKSDSKD